MIKKYLFKIIEFYQAFISPNLGENCRFWPSCSKYTYSAIEKYGVIRGLWLGARRLLRCHPYSSGGIDLP